MFALKRKALYYCQVAKRFEQVFSHRYCESYSLKGKEANDRHHYKDTLPYIEYKSKKCLVDLVAHRVLWRKRANDLSTCRLEGQDVIPSMTPTKVRGKRASAQTERSTHSVNSLLNPYSPGKGKRPLSRAASHSSSPSAKAFRHTNSPSEEPGRDARLAAPLEKLPVELLETIFLHNLNISLPQASPIIGEKLASKHVKSQLVLRACSMGRPDVCPCEYVALYPTILNCSETQSAILRLRWMTFDFLRQLVPEFITKTVVRELSERGLQWLGKGPLVTKETGSTIRQYLEDNALRFTNSSQDDLPMFGNVSWLVENPPRFIRLSFGLHDGLVSIEERRIRGLRESAKYIRSSSAERDHWRVFCGVNGCKVPEKLLHGPWTTKKCDFLEMVIRGNATVDWVATTSGEIAEQGLMQALRENNARATRLLVTRSGRGLCGLPCSPDSHEIEKVDSGPWPREDLVQAKACDLRGIGVVPRTIHLRTAVIEAGCQQDVVESLLVAKDANIDFEDRAVLDWAVEKECLGDERGRWLLSKLSRAA